MERWLYKFCKDKRFKTLKETIKNKRSNKKEPRKVIEN